jgi:O-antigen/teichoic acid export membrane protein
VAFTGISWPAGARRRALLRESFAVGLPTIPHSLGIYVLAAGDRVIVERLEGLAAVARFHVAYIAGSLGIFLLSALNNAWSPVVFGARDEDRWQVLADTSAAVWRVGALAAGALALGAPAGLLVLAPASYDRAALAEVTAIVAASAIPMVLYLSNVHIVFWLARTGVLAWVTPLSAAANIGLNLLLIPALGLTGAAIATLITYVLQAVVIRWRASRLADVPWRVRPAVQAALIGAALVGLALLLPATGVWVALRAVAAVAVGGALVAFVARGAFSRDDAGADVRS